MDAFDQPLMTTRQAAERYGVSIETIWNWLKNGTLQAFRVGGRWRIPVVQDFGGKVQPSLPPEPHLTPERALAIQQARDILKQKHGF